ncbi:MtnX-like HAD-IB family phosphatase [Caldanaerobius polysaccharolyticus]|uniref:MtnX-like HAD-IB family phosphatase n=1 Tax=Caldanaerobius polysaccharolyticus TaxID=44256 RepID=UPI00047E6228|nr:MtnX-like HAD-IB family phosphatase [Caldanaerobius polysaccharolyticus]
MRAYLLDFDGTMTVEDVGDGIIKNFAKDGWQEYLELWVQRKITTEQCAKGQWELIEGPSQQLYDYIQSRELDPYLPEFLQYCKQENYAVYINSDGFDFYIKRILEKYHLDLKGYYNHLSWDGNRWCFDFPFSDSQCKLCGNCKANNVKKLKDKGYEVVYVGDGYSDRCACSYADTVYAKNHLLQYCIDMGLPHIPFNNFKDILEGEKKRAKTV